MSICVFGGATGFLRQCHIAMRPFAEGGDLLRDGMQCPQPGS